MQAAYFTRKSESFNRRFFNNLSLCSATGLLLFSRQGVSSFQGKAIV